LRPTLFNYIVTREEFTGYTREVFQWVLDGKLDVKIHEIYPLEEIKRVHEDLEGRKTTGKLLVKI
jgi:NADPH2:quinone reductase